MKKKKVFFRHFIAGIVRRRVRTVQRTPETQKDALPLTGLKLEKQKGERNEIKNARPGSASHDFIVFV